MNDRFRISILPLLFFFLLGLAKDVFAGCEDYSATVTYYKTAAAQTAAYNQTTGYTNSYSGTSCSTCVSYTCFGIQPGLTFKQKYKNVDGIQVSAIFVLNSSCPDSDGDGSCDTDECGDERRSLSKQCGGDDQYTINEQTCEGQCNNCPTEREMLAQQCCGPDNFTIDSTTCSGDCKPDANCYCDMAALEMMCPLGIKTVNWTICQPICFSCNSLAQSCSDGCGGTGGTQAGCTESSPGTCMCNDPPDKTCEDVSSECQAGCQSKGGVKEFECQIEEGSGGPYPVSYCECTESKTKEEEPGPDSEPPQNPEDPPNDDPTSGDDISGWLASIKHNTDIIAQNTSDSNGWLEGIKHNTDELDSISQNTSRSVAYLESITHFMQQIKSSIFDLDSVPSKIDTTNSTLSGIASKIDSTNSSLSGIASGISSANSTLSNISTGIGAANNTLSGIGTSLSDIKSGLSNLNIGTSAEGIESVVEGEYGEEPTDEELPEAETLNAAFGEFDYRDDFDDYRSRAKSLLESIAPVASGSSCHVSFDIPYLSLSGVKYYNASFDACPYADLISYLGSILVFVTALRELFNLA